MKKIPLMLINPRRARGFVNRLQWLSKSLVSSELKNNINQSRLKVKPELYVGTIILNLIVYSFLFSGLMTLLLTTQTTIIKAIIQGLTYGLIISSIISIILYYYPKIIAGKIKEEIDSELLFVLNDLLIQVRSNIDLYQALVNVVESGYDYVSTEFQEVVDDVESGKSMVEALKNLALRTKSDYLKRVAWQLINSVKSGGNAERVIITLISELETHYHSLINNYTKELNVLTLIYLTLAVVSPTIGLTVLIILSAFGGLVVSRETIIGLVAVIILIQPALIGYINSRRPLLKL